MTNTAYAAVNRFRLDDLRPHIYRTHDGGKTWKEIVSGIPDGDIVNAVREDPVRKGLLFCGTERAVYVSFDDGDDWQSLRLNMPATSIRDLVVHDDDIVVGTHGRSRSGFSTTSRRCGSSTIRSRRRRVSVQAADGVSEFAGTSTPTRRCRPKSRCGQNPPDGAIINYYLKTGAAPNRPGDTRLVEQTGSFGGSERRQIRAAR